jgi:hypothetical protein
MAKGLKLGDAVTVREEMRMPRKSDAYKQGLKRLKPGEIGRIVELAEGRSVVVEFAGGKRVKLASQRLDRAESPSTDTEVNGKRQASAGSTGKSITEANLIDYNNPNLITTVANRLLLSGGLQADSDAVIVQIKLSELPTSVQKQVKALMRAKLDLSPQAQLGAKPKRRGRKPKNTKS